MRILLTGAGGQVGSALATALQPLGDVIATDCESFDLAQSERVRDAALSLRPDVIVNAAAYTDVERAEDEEQIALTINGVSVGELAAAARELSAPLVHYSTDYVFDGVKQTPYLEADPAAPLSAYGRTKLDGEIRIRDSGCPHLIIRTSWVYAARGRNFLQTMLRLAGERDELRIVDDQFGAPTYAGFIARATSRLVQQMCARDDLKARVERGDTVHLVNAGVTSWYGFASAIFAAPAVQSMARVPRLLPVKSAEFKTRAVRPANSRLSTERARTVWNIDPPDWRQSLDECLRELNPQPRSGAAEVV